MDGVSSSASDSTVVLDPTNETRPAVRRLLDRPSDVKGLTVGLLDISKDRKSVV